MLTADSNLDAVLVTDSMSTSAALSDAQGGGSELIAPAVDVGNSAISGTDTQSINNQEFDLAFSKGLEGFIVDVPDVNSALLSDIIESFKHPAYVDGSEKPLLLQENVSYIALDVVRRKLESTLLNDERLDILKAVDGSAVESLAENILAADAASACASWLEALPKNTVQNAQYLHAALAQYRSELKAAHPILAQVMVQAACNAASIEVSVIIPTFYSG